MANITLSSRASVDASTAMYAAQISGKVAGADIAALTPVYLDPTTDKVMPYATGKIFAGVAARSVKSGQAVTVYGIGTRFHASDSALTAALYFAGAGGVIADAATTDDTQGAFLRVGPNDLQVIRTGKLA